MKRTRFTESQIVASIKKQESGIPAKDVCRELGISDATFYNWKAKYGGMETSDVKRIKEMGSGVIAVQKIVAELTFENRAMKGFIEKVITPADKREAVFQLIEEAHCSVSKACKIVKLPRSSFQYTAKTKDDSQIEDALEGLVKKHPVIGFGKAFIDCATVAMVGIISE
ncbi:MAG: transposase [Chitinophagaceae bacterium]|nr:transposase [Chitinophagaceae bacterium]